MRRKLLKFSQPKKSFFLCSFSMFCFKCHKKLTIFYDLKIRPFCPPSKIFIHLIEADEYFGVKRVGVLLVKMGLVQ